MGVVRRWVEMLFEWTYSVSTNRPVALQSTSALVLRFIAVSIDTPAIACAHQYPHCPSFPDLCRSSPLFPNSFRSFSSSGDLFGDALSLHSTGNAWRGRR